MAGYCCSVVKSTGHILHTGRTFAAPMLGLLLVREARGATMNRAPPRPGRPGDQLRIAEPDPLDQPASDAGLPATPATATTENGLPPSRVLDEGSPSVARTW